MASTIYPCMCGNQECTDDSPVCNIHYKHEPDQEGDYLACGECFHVFRTAEELIEEYNKDRPDFLLAITDASRVATCPHCAHDF